MLICDRGTQRNESRIRSVYPPECEWSRTHLGKEKRHRKLSRCGPIGLWIGDSEFAINFVQPAGVEQALYDLLGVGRLVQGYLVRK